MWQNWAWGPQRKLKGMDVKHKIVRLDDKHHINREKHLHARMMMTAYK